MRDFFGDVVLKEVLSIIFYTSIISKIKILDDLIREFVCLQWIKASSDCILLCLSLCVH